MHNNKLIFQMATHHLPKMALRLEYLLNTVYQACSEVHPIVHNYALQSLIEIIQFIQKPELKSRFLKELMRIEHNVHKTPSSISPELYTKLYAQIHVLNHVVGGFGEGIQHNAFLQSIQQTPHRKECEEEIPQLILWLESAPSMRQTDLSGWLRTLKTLHNTITIYVALIKGVARFQKIRLNNGFYQCPLPPKTHCHLILLQLEKSKKLIPQMQIGHHGLSLRLLDAVSLREIHKTDAEIDLAICQI